MAGSSTDWTPDGMDIRASGAQAPGGLGVQAPGGPGAQASGGPDVQMPGGTWPTAFSAADRVVITWLGLSPCDGEDASTWLDALRASGIYEAVLGVALEEGASGSGEELLDVLRPGAAPDDPNEALEDDDWDGDEPWTGPGARADVGWPDAGWGGAAWDDASGDVSGGLDADDDQDTEGYVSVCVSGETRPTWFPRSRAWHLLGGAPVPVVLRPEDLDPHDLPRDALLLRELLSIALFQNDLMRLILAAARHGDLWALGEESGTRNAHGAASDAFDLLSEG